LKAEGIHERVAGRFGDKVLGFTSEAVDPWIEVDPASLHDVLSFLRDDEELRFDSLMCLSGVDYGTGDGLGVTYHLCSTRLGHKITIKVKVSRDDPVVPSVADLWRTADWHEREAYDLLGITFEGHPDLTRILLPDDWEGHPLRKDYVVNKTYHGIRFKD
jgi:NADH-quinone oxidoreductase subunit C